jgi:hypothetical protein
VLDSFAECTKPLRRATRGSPRTSILSLLSPDNDGIAPEELKELHRGGVEVGDRVVIRRRLVHDQPIGAVSSRTG